MKLQARASFQVYPDCYKDNSPHQKFQDVRKNTKLFSMTCLSTSPCITKNNEENMMQMEYYLDWK